jgi:hypothetical protein
MEYQDIPAELKFYLPKEETYNSLSEDVKDFLIKGARSQWERAGSIPIGSIANLHQIEPQNKDYGELLQTLYRCMTKHSTMGITDRRYDMIGEDTINNRDFICIVQEACRRVGATNVTLTFVDIDDILHYVSFSRKDLQTYSTEQLLGMLLTAPSEWDRNLYGGSDYVMTAMKSYTLSRRRFDVTVSHVLGGYGKMFAAYYETLGLENNGDDCLIQCFMEFLGIEFNQDYIDRIRKEMYFEKGKLGLDHIAILESKFNIRVDVYKDQRILEKIESRCTGREIPLIHSYRVDIVKDEKVLIHGDGTSKFKILHKDNHYDVITKSYDAKDCHCPYTGDHVGFGKKFGQAELIRRLKSKFHHDQENLTAYTADNDGAVYYFFDYETIFDPNTLELKPYAVSVCKADDNFNILETNFYLGIDTCDMQFCDYLFKETPEENEVKYLIGYNNSRFDNYILLKSALKYGLFVGHTRFSQNTIVSMNISKFRVRDLCRIINRPLDEACKNFKIVNAKQTGLIDHHDFQFAYMRDKFDVFCNEKYDKLKKYAVSDVESLCELYQKVKAATSKLINVDITSFYTLAGMSYSTFKECCQYELSVLDGNYEAYDTLIRKSVIGGRSQVYLNKATDLISIDCVSLYPYVMLNRQYPVGYPKSTESYIEGKIGVYNVIIHSQPKYNIIPMRRKDKPLDWNCKDKIECVLTNVDIECLLRHHCAIEVKDGIYWEESTNKLFDTYFESIVKEKLRQDELKKNGSDEYNESVREMCKLLMNVLSGKLAQRIYTREIALCRNASDVDRFFSRTIKDSQKFVKIYNAYIAEGEVTKGPTMPSIYGTLIYAYARSYMYDMVISKVDTLYGMDTDSAFISKDDFNKLDKHIMGTEFGQFKVEYKDFDAIFIAPKCYVFHRKEEIVKARFKGISIGKDKLYQGETITDPIELYNLYHSDKFEATGLNIYEELYSKGYSQVICNNITKRLIHQNNGIYLSNHTFIKEIKIEHNDVRIQKIEQ